MQPIIVNMHVTPWILQMLYAQQFKFAAHDAAWHGPNESGSTVAFKPGPPQLLRPWLLLAPGIACAA